jgi:hypothetical protein
MSLPKLDVPLYTFVAPSTGKEYKFRPFTVKEQKLLLMANEDKENVDIHETIKQLVENCVVSPDFKFENLSLFDLEYLFIQLRMRSIGETISLDYVCKNFVGEKTCDNPMKIDFDLKTIAPPAFDKNNKKIFFTDKVGIVMRYPGTEMIRKTSAFASDKNAEKSVGSLLFDMIVDCVDYIFDGEKIFYAKDIDRDEIVDFVERLTTKDFEKIQNFIESLPATKSEIVHTCGKCGFVHKIPLEGLTNFFD